MLLWVVLNKVAELSVGADVMLAFISETSLMLNLQVDYPTSLQTIFYITSILAFQIDIVSPGCLFSWTAASSFYLQVDKSFPPHSSYRQKVLSLTGASCYRHPFQYWQPYFILCISDVSIFIVSGIFDARPRGKLNLKVQALKK